MHLIFDVMSPYISRIFFLSWRNKISSWLFCIFCASAIASNPCSLTIVPIMGRINTKVERLSRHDHFKLNFYRMHVICFLCTIILSSVIMYGSGVNGNSDDAEAHFKLRYIDAIFLCTSAMTNAGLNTVNLYNLTGFQQSVLCILILIGNVTVTTNAAIWIRRFFLRKHMKEFLQRSKAARGKVEQLDREDEGGMASIANGAIHSVSSSIRRLPQTSGLHKVKVGTTQRLSRHHEMGHGGLPYPWEWEFIRKLGAKLAAPTNSIQERLHCYLSFQPSIDRRVRPFSSV